MTTPEHPVLTPTERDLMRHFRDGDLMRLASTNIPCLVGGGGFTTLHPLYREAYGHLRNLDLIPPLTEWPRS